MPNSTARSTWKGVEPFAQEMCDPGLTASHYDDFVKELAVRITASPEEADAAIDEMMSDIYRTAAGPALTIAQRLRERIAMVRLLKLLR
jgi:hypothetical protein